MVKKETLFIIVFLATILAERITAFFTPTASFVFHDRLHHLYYGIIFMVILIMYNRKLYRQLFIPFAIGLGLIADELFFLMPPFYGDGSKAYYFKVPSVAGAILIALLVIIFRKSIFNGIRKISESKR